MFGLKDRKGFTLVEIALALGVVSFALVAILGMLPMALSASRESRSQSRASLIGESIFSDLRSGTHAAAPVFLSKQITTPASAKYLDLNSAQAAYIAYDGDGEPAGQISAAQYDSGVPGMPSAEFLAKITASPDPDLPRLARVSVVIGTPAAAAQARREAYRLGTKIGDPQ